MVLLAVFFFYHLLGLFLCIFSIVDIEFVCTNVFSFRIVRARCIVVVGGGGVLDVSVMGAFGSFIFISLLFFMHWHFVVRFFGAHT